MAGAAAGLTGFLSRLRFARADDETPHFLLCIQIQMGVDNSYLFDARVPKLTDKNLKQNYLLRNDANPSSTKPDLFTPDLLQTRTITTDLTGSTALRSPFVDELWNSHKDVFSVVNGVYMLRGDIGHNGNEAFLWGNSGSGGVDIFPPTVGKLLGNTPLEATILREENQIFPEPTNLSGSAVLQAATLTGVAAAFRDGPKIDPSSPLWNYVLARSDANAAGDGLFATGSAQLGHGLRNAKATGEALAAVPPTPVPPAPPNAPSLVPLPFSVQQQLAFFSRGLTRVGMIVQTRFDVDLHSNTESQKHLVDTFTNIGQELRDVFALLKSTMFVGPDGTAVPFIERTTVLIASEFGRTTKSQNSTAPVGATGSDHNPFSNSVLIGGRGIVPGLVVGGSDLTDCDDNGKYTNVSGAHNQKNQPLDQAMGLPFDFKAQRVRTDLPDSFSDSDYICMPSVTNTLLDVFGVPDAQRLRLGSTNAPLLSVLRKTGS
jgi:hypothetical protein